MGRSILICVLAGVSVFAGEPEWNPAAIKECDRACLTGIMDGYVNAIFKHDPKLVPHLALDVRITENTGQMDIGEVVLWRSQVAPTSFKIYVADPVEGQVAEQAWSQHFPCSFTMTPGAARLRMPLRECCRTSSRWKHSPFAAA